MTTMRRFVRDESGMTMGLAVIMILLLSVMGAGLLTFVSKDLNTVAEENRGQKAFEIADAGIEAAKRQLASLVDRTKYDGDGPPMDDGNCGTDASGESQWSALRCEDPVGVTLTELDGPGGTPNSVTVTIEYRGPATDDFRVVSEGTYGDPPQQAKRRIEAIFDGLSAGAGGGGEEIGHPIYYTPSNIKIVGPASPTANCSTPVYLNQVSLFTQSDILFQTHPRCQITTMGQFQNDYNDASGLIKTSNNDKLCDWNSQIPAAPTCFTEDLGGTGNWNTVSRTIGSPGLAAEGKICSVPDAATNACPSTATSIADGVRGFDSTTLPTFVDKEPLADGSYPENEAGTISYPFPLPQPIPAGLKAAACAPPGTAAACTKTPPPISYFTGTPTNSTWGLNTSNASNNRVAFVDAQNQTLTWNPPSGQYKGIIVVWCGRLVMNKNFEGIVLNLYGDDLPGNTSCNKTTVGQEHVGTYRNLGNSCQCWVYAEGGSAQFAGIQLDHGSTVQFRPSSDWSFDDNLFEGPPPTSFALKSWRELYE